MANLFTMEHNTIKVGDIILESNSITINELCGMVVALLQQQEIKDYLKNFNNEKLISGRPSGIE